MKIGSEDHRRIAEAVAAAEALTDGEIRCVLARESADSRSNALMWASGSALLLPAGALLLGFKPQALTAVFGAWTVGHLAARDAAIATTLTVYIAIQVAVFAVAWGLASWPALRRALTPKALASRRVHVAALEQFAALGLHRTRGRTGVLLYASLAEHRAEVLADEGIHGKAPEGVWDEVVNLMIGGLARGAPGDGFVAAVERTGQVLAEHLPPRSHDDNELPDELIERR